MATSVSAAGPQCRCHHALGLQEDIRLGKKLAAGGFGTVFRGDLLDVYPEAELPVVVKKVLLVFAKLEVSQPVSSTSTCCVNPRDGYPCSPLQGGMLHTSPETYPILFLVAHAISAAGGPHVQAKEFGVPEVWMNERIMRIAPRSFAEFLYAFEEANGKQPDLLWLVWRYEGDYTLFDLLQVRSSYMCVPTHNITLTLAQHRDPH